MFSRRTSCTLGQQAMCNVLALSQRTRFAWLGSRHFSQRRRLTVSSVASEHRCCHTSRSEMQAALADENVKPIESVNIDALVVCQIIQHGREFCNDAVTGQLLGLDDEQGVLHISRSFPFPHHCSENDDNDMDDGDAYQIEMMKCLRHVHVDHNTVGWYASTGGNQPFALNHNLLETQFNYQQTIRQSILLLFDLASAHHSIPSFKAYRLSTAFMGLYREKRFTLDSLLHERITFSTMAQELPIVMSCTTLAAVILSRWPVLHEPHAVPVPSTMLSLVEKRMELLNEALEEHGNEVSKFQHYAKSHQRYLQIFNNALSARRAENESRQKRGEEPLSEEDATAHLRAPYEPSRLDDLLLLHQIHSLNEQIDQLSTNGLSCLPQHVGITER